MVVGKTWIATFTVVLLGLGKALAYFDVAQGARFSSTTSPSTSQRLSYRSVVGPIEGASAAQRFRLRR